MATPLCSRSEHFARRASEVPFELKLFLVRHGETPWTIAKRYQGTTDVPLSPRGIRQAKAVAKVLRREALDRIYTSGLKRAQDTARLIARKTGIKPVVDRRLNELHFGNWEGAHYRRLSKEGGIQFRQWREGRLKRPPGGESVDSLARRVGQFFREIARRHRKEKVAIVSHGGPIRMILFKILRSSSSIWSFRIDPGSISLVEGDPRLFQIAWTNRINHLPSR